MAPVKEAIGVTWGDDVGDVPPEQQTPRQIEFAKLIKDYANICFLGVENATDSDSWSVVCAHELGHIIGNLEHWEGGTRRANLLMAGEDGTADGNSVRDQILGSRRLFSEQETTIRDWMKKHKFTK